MIFMTKSQIVKKFKAVENEIVGLLHEGGTAHVDGFPIIVNGEQSYVLKCRLICDMCRKPIIDIQSAKRYDFYLEDDEVKDVPFETKYLCPECEAEMNKPMRES